MGGWGPRKEGECLWSLEAEESKGRYITKQIYLIGCLLLCCILMFCGKRVFGKNCKGTEFHW